MIRCPHCHAPIGLADLTCSSCGQSLDANGDGLPDPLEKLIEAKARSLLEEQKAEERAALQEQAIAQAEAELELARQRAAEQRAAEIAAAKTELEQLEHALEKNEAQPYPRVYFPWPAPVGLIVACLLFGFVAMGFEGSLDASLSGRLFCGMVCQECRGPGRVFSWHPYETPTESTTDWVQVCDNPTVDVEHMPLSGPPVEHEFLYNYGTGKLERYRLSMWWGFPVYVLGSFLLGIVVLPFVAARVRRGALRAERRTLQYRIELRQRLLEENGLERRAGYR